MTIHPISLATHEKALQINLSKKFYGTFAEIGAGQEVARWFFRVGGAAGTIAKSMSAYDMSFSDAIYGKGERYVSRERLKNMFDHEYELLLERLDATRGADACFFVFADTVRARSYEGTSECHGWMGLRFQLEPRGAPHHILVHVRMLDKENVGQQEALGIIGVNLVYGAFFLNHDPVALIKSLADGVGIDRIEVDMIRFDGPAFAAVDNRLMSLELVERNLSYAAMFAPTGEVLQPSEALHKRPILVERGSFRPVTRTNVDMFDCARREFATGAVEGEQPVLELAEITMSNLLSTAPAPGELDHADFLARADLLCAVGKTVMISNYAEYYRLAAYLSRMNGGNRIGMVMGVSSLRELFDERYYEALEGGILESFGRLFKGGVKIYAYPVLEGDKIVGVQEMEVPTHLRHLYRHLTEDGRLVALEGAGRECLKIFSRDVLAKIRAGDASWKQMVPPPVAELICRRKFFGCTE